MNTIRRYIPITLVMTLLATLLAGCHGSDDDDLAAAAETLERALAPREVRLITAEVREERPSVQLVGEIRAFDTVTLSSEVAGKVDRVLAEVGDRVAAGTPLVWVDREGQTEPLGLPPGIHGSFELSPDGRRLALPITEGPDGERASERSDDCTPHCEGK